MFFAGYTVLQFVVLATAWNILGGYTGYVNFGSAAFFALGAYRIGVLRTSSIRCRSRLLIVHRRRRLAASSASAWAI